MITEKIDEINAFFKECFINAEMFKDAELTSDVRTDISDLITKRIPSVLKSLLNNDNYIIKGSIGAGRATKSPWIAILDKQITTSTRDGVYIVFVFSSDYKSVYLTLNQGTTVPGQFGPRLRRIDILHNTQRIREKLKIKNDFLKIGDDADIADERYRAGTIYYTLWDIVDGTKGLKILNFYLEIYEKYKLCLNSANMKEEPKVVFPNINTYYRLYVSAIKSKPFLLLAGISGTGKSRIVRELARACWEEGSGEYKAQKPKNFEMIQVKPNWHDSSELIGYVSRIDGEKFVVGPFLKFIAKAIQNPDVPYFLCLDEMNLAPVEQYFAEYLSVIESRKWDNGEIVTDPIIDYEPTDAYKSLIDQLFYDDETRKKYLTKENGERLRIPQNLIVVGTVNMDETTFSFSRKVLDRAMTIEMNEVDLGGGLDKKYESIGKLGAAELIGNAVEGVDVYADNKGVCDRVINYLKAINGELEGTPFKVAYRTRNEFLLYVVNNLPYNKDENGEDIAQEVVMARALDEITSMKILSRIEGDTEKIGDLLDRLKEVIKKQLNEISSGKEYSGTKDKEGTEYAVSLAKLKEMKNRLKSGYTSFWS